MADEDNEQGSPFARRGFIAAAGVVAVIAILGITLGIVNATRDDPEPDPTGSSSSASASGSPSAAPTSDPTEAAGGASVCGLDGTGSASGRLATAPAVAEWAYEGTTAYPVSPEFGPGAEDEAGAFRYCFQQSPEGALFAASYALAVATDQSKVPAWIDYFAAPGPYRDQFLEPGTDAGSDTAARLRIAGFRLLAYTGDTARVDIAMVASADGQTFNLSGVYNLVWVDGDWKIDTSTPEPGTFSTIPDLTGYVSWGE